MESGKQQEGVLKNSRPATWPAPVAATSFEVFQLASFHLAYGFVYGSMGLCILPITAGHLCPKSASIGLGCMLMLCGVSQLVCPIVGKLSDSWRSMTVYGRRRPFFHGGSIGAFVGVFGMYLSSFYLRSYAIFCVFLFIGMAGLNTCYSIQAGLAPDLLIDKNIDSISATVAANGLVGSSLGFFVIMATSHMDFHFVYPVYIVFVVTTLVFTDRVALEIQSRMENGGVIDGNPMEQLYLEPANEASTVMDSRLDWPVCPQVYGECTWRSIKSTLVIDKSENSDFYWVFVSRTCYYVGVSVQTFIQPFLRDVANVAEESDQRFKLASIALSAQTVAAVTAVSMGTYVKDNNNDVSKRHVIYFAALTMTLVYAGFALVPLMNPYGFEWLMFISLPYGMGNGCFLAVDYAIAIAVIEKDKAAERLGVWGVSSFIGAAIGPMIFGVLIELFGGDLVNNLLTGHVKIEDLVSGAQLTVAEHYGYNGYLLMLICGGSATALAGFLLSNVETPL